MFENSNKSIIRKLAIQKIRSNKQRRLLLIIAIALTALLLTGTLTVLSSLQQSMVYTTMRQVGTKVHGGFKYLTEEQYEVIKKHPDIKKSSKMQTIGMLTDTVFKTRSQQVFYMDENAMAFSFMLPLLKGKVPSATNEVVLSTLSLDMMGLPHEIGTKVTVNMDIDGENIPMEWVVSGIYEGDHLAMADIWVVSERYANALLKGKSIAYNPENDHYFGLIQMGVMLNNHYHIQDKLYKIAKESGVQLTDQYAYNWAYEGGYQTNLSDYISIAIVLLLLILSGYLVIYNIFYIGIIQDIHFYGMLKTIGTTKKQIRRLVYIQALKLASIGIPIGLLLGYLVGITVMPYVQKAIAIVEIKYGMNPWIFVFGSLLTLLTIYISAIKPTKIAAGVSPIEAIRTCSAERHPKKKVNSKRRKQSIVFMAKENVLRYKKKAILVVLSMSLSMVLFQCVFNTVKATDSGSMINYMIAGDYSLANVNWFQYRFNEEAPIASEVISQIEEQKGITANKVFCTYAEMATYKGLIEQLKLDNDFPTNDDDPLIKGRQSADVYGLSENMMPYLENIVVEGSIDYEAYKSGNYVILDKYMPLFTGQGEAKSYDYLMKVGDKITLYDEHNSAHEYEVMALVENVPFYLYDGNFTNLSLNIYMSEGNFEVFNPKKPLMLLSIDTKEADKIAFQNKLDEITRIYPDVAYKNRDDYKTDLESFDRLEKVVGYGLSLFLGFIALVNFINTSFTSIYARRQELAMLQSIGMTSKQLLKMLIGESILLAFAAWIVSVCMSIPLSYILIKGVMFTKGGVTILPLIIIAPLMIISLSCVPIIAYNGIKKMSLVERLRVVE